MDTGAGVSDDEHLESVRQPWMLVVVYTFFYAAVFVAGFIGNVFVVLAVLLNSNLRSVTDYLISSLALADLLIILFCLPTTLLNNLLTEWQLGAIGCKLSTFINSTTSCASIFTLVAVTADRYLAICHTLKYTLWEARPVIYLIFVIWFISALLASPNLIIYDEILYDLVPPNGTLVARLCVSTQENFLHFIIVNLIIAFLLPVILICVSYSLIFFTVSHHQSLAIDARIRDERVKLRVAQMMLTVIIVFMLCWTPLYGLYCYLFLAPDRESSFFQFATSVLRPIFQWLSLLSSSLNPLIYIAYSQKYRRAFHQLLLMPCRVRYQSLRRATRATLRLPPLKHDERSTIQNSTEYFGICSGIGNYSTMMHGGKFNRKVSLQQYYYYHSNSFNPAGHKYSSISACGSNKFMRKMSEQSTCYSHSHSHSRRSSRQSLGVTSLNQIKPKKNSLQQSCIGLNGSSNNAIYSNNKINGKKNSDTTEKTETTKEAIADADKSVEIYVEVNQNPSILKSPFTAIKSYVWRRGKRNTHNKKEINNYNSNSNNKTNPSKETTNGTISSPPGRLLHKFSLSLKPNKMFNDENATTSSITPTTTTTTTIINPIQSTKVQSDSNVSTNDFSNSSKQNGADANAKVALKTETNTESPVSTRLSTMVVRI